MRKIKENSQIFFNATLTPVNSYFIVNSKKTARNTGLKVFFTSGKVHVEKANKQNMMIQSDEDLSIFKSYVKEFQRNQKNESPSNWQ